MWVEGGRWEGSESHECFELLRKVTVNRSVAMGQRQRWDGKWTWTMVGVSECQCYACLYVRTKVTIPERRQLQDQRPGVAQRDISGAQVEGLASGEEAFTVTGGKAEHLRTDAYESENLGMGI